jgi:endonuclease YncB( thermonuclease family)
LAPTLLALLAAVVSSVGTPAPAAAHPGALDEYGGHFDGQGFYHYHKPARDMAVRKGEWLEWVRFPLAGTVQGVAETVDESADLWVRVPYRPAYQELVQDVAPANRDDRRQLVRVVFLHVSPRETGARNPRFKEWFRKQVAHELNQKLRDQPVTVNFQVVGGQAGLLRGMVFLGEENVNLWLVLNGWSYYVLSDGESPYDARFRQAEDAARRDKSGIWAHVR